MIIEWNGTNELNNQIVSGIYLCEMRADNYKKVQKMILVK